MKQSPLFENDFECDEKQLLGYFARNFFWKLQKKWFFDFAYFFVILKS